MWRYGVTHSQCRSQVQPWSGISGSALGATVEPQGGCTFTTVREIFRFRAKAVVVTRDGMGLECTTNSIASRRIRQVSCASCMK